MILTLARWLVTDLLKNKFSRRGSVLGYVFIVIVFIFILATSFYLLTSNRFALVQKYDTSERARYIAKGLIEIVRLKMKELPVEFGEALEEYERGKRNNLTERDMHLWPVFIDDFNSETWARANLGLETPATRMKVISIERIFIGTEEVQAGGVSYLTDIIEITADACITEPGEPQSTARIKESVKFKRKFNR